MIHLRCENPGPRLTYAANFIFGRVLGLPYEWIGAQVDIDGPVLSCGDPPGLGEPFVPTTGRIEFIRKGEGPPATTILDDMPVLFYSTHKGGYPFDIFAAVFYCLARVEEYSSADRDDHGRFPVRASIFSPWVRRPYVDEWIRHFARWLVSVNVLPDAPQPVYHWINTIDVDVAYAYQGRGVFRQLGAAMRDVFAGHIRGVQERMDVLRGRQRDPYDTYQIAQSAGNAAAGTIFFVLCGKRKGLDISLNPRSAAMKRLVQSLAEWAEVGIHPSYASLHEPGLVKREKALLEAAAGEPIESSRQHFLRFVLPDTFTQLAQLGVQREYSMGFADEVGFRAGTAHTHSFFDLEQNGPTTLETVPLIAMDSAMKNYLQLSPVQAIEVLEQLWRRVQQTGGNMTTVWHNHSISDHGEWAEWQNVYIRFSDLVAHKS